MRLLRIFLLAGVMASWPFFTSAQILIFNENPRVQLVSEFVRELEVLYLLEETAKKEFAEDKSSIGQLTTRIRSGTRTIFNMNESIHLLDDIAVDGEPAKFRNLLKQSDSKRIRITQEMVDMSKTMLSEPKPGVYGAITAHAAELTAQMEQIDRSMLDMALAMFMVVLLDEKRVSPDGNFHHLLLTKKDRADMIHSIDTVYGPKLEDKNANYIVSAAALIKHGLTRPTYKSADEP